jgi:preprotein translocase subunit SecG
MASVILVIHILVAIGLVAMILLQRSEGGALGIGGGGGGGGGFMTGRGVGNLLTKTTAGLALAFFVTSITLTVLARQSNAPTSVLDKATQQPGSPKAPTSSAPVLPNLPTKPAPTTPQVPQSQ